MKYYKFVLNDQCIIICMVILIILKDTINKRLHSIHYMYEISVAAGNTHGFGEETNTWFLTSEEGECY